MAKVAKMLGTDKEWRNIRRWLKGHHIEGAKLALKGDDQLLLDWEFERSTLEWAIKMTPAKTPLGLKVKAMAARVCPAARAELLAQIAGASA